MGRFWEEPVKKKKVWREASDLHSLVKRKLMYNLFLLVCVCVCGQLLSNCKMHLIIVYPDTKMLCSSIFEHETAASVTTILKHYVVPVMSHTQKTERSTSHTIYSWIPPCKAYAGLSKLIDIRTTFPCDLNTANVGSTSRRTGKLLD